MEEMKRERKWGKEDSLDVIDLGLKGNAWVFEGLSRREGACQCRMHYAENSESRWHAVRISY